MTEVAEHTEAYPKLFRLSRTDYYRMAKLGFFLKQPVELIDGKVYAMPPQGDRHERCVGLLQRRLMKAFGDDYWVRPQMSLELKPKSAPEPDISVVHGGPDHGFGKPQSALLVVEVSDSTLRLDQLKKSRLYARNGILDYWIINLVENQLEVYRSPLEDRAKPFGFRYASVTRLGISQTVSPLALPDVEIAVFDILPLKR